MFQAVLGVCVITRVLIDRYNIIIPGSTITLESITEDIIIQVVITRVMVDRYNIIIPGSTITLEGIAEVTTIQVVITKVIMTSPDGFLKKHHTK